MSKDELTLEELSERSGVEARTLRSWVSEGLLSPPFKPGRGARYPAANAYRALAVKALKDVHGLSLSEIGRNFIMASDEQIREWALEAGATSVTRGSAREYLRKVQARNASEPLQKNMDVHPNKVPPRSSTKSLFKTSIENPSMSSRHGARRVERQVELAGIERLILQMEEVLDAPAPRRSRGTTWTRISITPDFELSVRGELEPRERVLFEQLADQFRAILTGRKIND